MKSVVITGSSKGIGLGMAQGFLKKGCCVALSARGKAALEKAVNKLGETFGPDKVIGQPCDVTDITQVQALWDIAQQQFGTVDIWINNAGMSNSKKMLWELDWTEIAPVVNTNIIGLIYGCQVALKGMLAQGAGQIYNFEGHGSNDSIVPGLTVYGTTKRAVRYFSESLMEEITGKPVQLGTIGPGIVVTDLMLNDMKTMAPEDLELVKPIYNVLGDKVETVTPYLVEEVLKNDKNGAKIDWLTPEKAAARMEDEKYLERNLLGEFGF